MEFRVLTGARPTEASSRRRWDTATPMSIQSYLDEAGRYSKEDSIFSGAAEDAGLDAAGSVKEFGR